MGKNDRKPKKASAPAEKPDQEDVWNFWIAIGLLALAGVLDAIHGKLFGFLELCSIICLWIYLSLWIRRIFFKGKISPLQHLIPIPALIFLLMCVHAGDYKSVLWTLFWPSALTGILIFALRLKVLLLFLSVKFMRAWMLRHPRTIQAKVEGDPGKG
jgi:hypothetical protein